MATQSHSNRLFVGLKSAARDLLRPELMGRLDYVRFPQLKSGFGGPFNGQKGRQAIFAAIIDACDIASILETGTYRGTTTEHMAAAGLPTVTIELDPRLAGYARMRLRRFAHVRVLTMDSRAAIRTLPTNTGTPFCYLDAHWNDDLPLRDEVDMILDRWPEAIIMIDDFEVKGDSNYEFDDYGPDQKLCLEYLQPNGDGDLTFHFPSLHASKETGQRRGCVVVARADAANAARLDAIPLLRRWKAKMSWGSR